MEDYPMMKCGHTANSFGYKKGQKVPGCAICGCTEVAEDKPSLEGRKAQCNECTNITPSAWNLPFFKYCEDKEFDEFYCGCHGWD